MSYQIIDEKIIGNKISSSGDFMQIKVVHIVCDSSASIPEPRPEWSAGSRCDVLADSGTVYILSISGEWKPVNFYNWGGDGGDFDPDSYYTKPQTDARITEKVAEIVADAPEDFDTLKEMSDWIENHEESAAAMNSAIQANSLAIAGKVDKVSGKRLSTEDYTTAEKTKLEGIETGANKTTVDSALSSSSTNPVQNKAVSDAIANKVDKVTGKGLSTEDYTTAEKNSLSVLSELDTATVTIDLNSQTWTESANGLFYTGNISVPNLYRVFSTIITGFNVLKTTYNVAVIANFDKTAIRLTASTNTFSNNANITVSVFGRFTS